MESVIFSEAMQIMANVGKGAGIDEAENKPNSARHFNYSRLTYDYELL